MAIVKQGKGYGVSVHVGGGKRKWLGTFEARSEAEATEEAWKRSRTAEACDEFVDRWLREYPPQKQSTYQTYENALRRFAEDFKGCPITGPLRKAPWARESGIVGTDRQVARAWALAHRHRAPVVRNLYGAAINEGITDSNPFANLKLPQSRGRKEIVPLEVEEVEKLIECSAVLRPEVRPTIAGMIAVLAYSGMRISELFALRFADVDLKAQEARISRSAHKGNVDTPKSGRPRIVLLPGPACEGIASAPRRLGQELCFVTPRDGTLFYPSSFGRYWDQVRIAFESSLSGPRREDLCRYRPASHAGLTPHELRHFAASWMLDEGASVEMVANQLGHSATKITETYGHPNEKAMRERLRSVLAPRPVANLSVVREANG